MIKLQPTYAEECALEECGWNWFVNRGQLMAQSKNGTKWTLIQFTGGTLRDVLCAKLEECKHESLYDLALFNDDIGIDQSIYSVQVMHKLNGTLSDWIHHEEVCNRAIKQGDKHGYILANYADSGIMQIQKNDESETFKSDHDAVKAAEADGISMIPVHIMPDNVCLEGCIDSAVNWKAISQLSRELSIAGDCSLCNHK